MILVYKLTFDDGTEYVGQTQDLNQRLSQHKSVWKGLFGLDIAKVAILEWASTREKALRLEASYIEAYGLDNLRNKFLDENRVDIDMISDKLAKDEEPDSPLVVIHTSDQIDYDTQKHKYLAAKMRQLENRYLSTFMKYHTIKDNMKHIDKIIDQAINEVF